MNQIAGTAQEIDWTSLVENDEEILRTLFAHLAAALFGKIDARAQMCKKVEELFSTIAGNDFLWVLVPKTRVLRVMLTLYLVKRTQEKSPINRAERAHLLHLLKDYLLEPAFKDTLCQLGHRSDMELLIFSHATDLQAIICSMRGTQNYQAWYRAMILYTELLKKFSADAFNEMKEVYQSLSFQEPYRKEIEICLQHIQELWSDYGATTSSNATHGAV